MSKLRRENQLIGYLFMETSFLVAVKCPECGGPACYPEGAYTFTCSYCGSVLRIKRNGVNLKYIIPSRIQPNDLKVIIHKILLAQKALYPVPTIHNTTTIYKPFWYFKGMLYYSHATKMENATEAKTWYYSFQANSDFIDTFISLSMRAEVLTLEPYDQKNIKSDEVILPIAIDKKEAYRIAESTADMNFQITVPQAKYKKLYLIGEHFFIIYYPIVQIICSRRGGEYRTLMLDGISKSLLADKNDKEEVPHVNEKSENSYCIKLLTHRCNNCGHDLQAKDFDIIFYCQVCSRLWLLKNGDYHSIKIKVLEAEKKINCVYLPFWRFEVIVTSQNTGIKLKTIGDLSTFMKMGRHILRNEDSDRPLRFYVPALVARNARALLKLATRINIHQKALPKSQNGFFPYGKILNASLPENEAEEMLGTIVFSVIGRQDQKALEFYSDFTIESINNELVWYPFESKGNFLLDNFHNYTFPSPFPYLTNNK